MTERLTTKIEYRKTRINADAVLAVIFSFLPTEFRNDPGKIQSTICELREKSEYEELLRDFEFINCVPPYSDRLQRAINRLGEAKLLSSLAPAFDPYIMDKSQKKAIQEYYLTDERLGRYQDKLREIAKELEETLK